MKKFISILISAILISASLFFSVPSVFAETSSNWILAPQGEYITHNDKTYYPIPDVSGSTFQLDLYGAYSGTAGENYLSVYLKYEDQQTRAMFGPYSKVYYFTGKDCPCIQVEFGPEYNSIYLVYVEEPYLQEYTNLAKGIADSYGLSNNYYYYGENYNFKLSSESFEKWKSDEKITTKAFMLSQYDQGYIKCEDKTGLVYSDCGIFFVDRHNSEVYLLPSDNYESVALDSYSDVTIYRLEDSNLSEEIIDYFYTEPEDDLEWLEPEDEDYTFGIIFCAFLFIVVPLALLVFSIVMICVIKDKKYHRSYITILIGSVLVLVACIAVIILFI